jgi:hypothetical protein
LCWLVRPPLIARPSRSCLLVGTRACAPVLGPSLRDGPWQMSGPRQGRGTCACREAAWPKPIAPNATSALRAPSTHKPPPSSGPVSGIVDPLAPHKGGPRGLAARDMADGPLVFDKGPYIICCCCAYGGEAAKRRVLRLRPLPCPPLVGAGRTLVRPLRGHPPLRAPPAQCTCPPPPPRRRRGGGGGCEARPGTHKLVDSLQFQ